MNVRHPTATIADPSLVAIDGEDQSVSADLIAEVGGLATRRGCDVCHRHAWSGVDRVPDCYRGCVLNVAARRKRAGFDPIGALDVVDRVAHRVGIAVKSDGPTRVVPRVDRESGDFGRVPLADEIGLRDRVRFAGFVSNAERDSLLADCRVCVCASEKEGWGLTVIEANRVGTPVVASDAPGLRDSVRDGQTGLLAPYGDVDAFADAIGRLLEDDTLALRMSREALRWSEHFDWDRAASEMGEAIDRARRSH